MATGGESTAQQYRPARQLATAVFAQKAYLLRGICIHNYLHIFHLILGLNDTYSPKQLPCREVAISIKIDEFCITTGGFCISNDDFNTNGQRACGALKRSVFNGRILIFYSRILIFY